jgi:hypothetical protein
VLGLRAEWDVAVIVSRTSEGVPMKQFFRNLPIVPRKRKRRASVRPQEPRGVRLKVERLEERVTPSSFFPHNPG